MRLSACPCCSTFGFGAARAPADSSGGGGEAPALAASLAILENLAAASRILALQGVVDAFGHVSMRHPDKADRFLMSRSLAPALVTPADILEHDLDGNPTSPDAPPVFYERFIHSEIYRARPDVQGIVHSHSLAVIPFGVAGTPVRAMYHNAAFLARGVPVFDIAEKFGATDMLVGSREKGVALAATLADNAVVLMRAHGSVAVGPSLETAVFRAIMTENNAKLQTQAMMLNPGGRLAALSPEEGELADVLNLKVVSRPWELWRRSLRG